MSLAEWCHLDNTISTVTMVKVNSSLAPHTQELYAIEIRVCNGMSYPLCYQWTDKCENSHSSRAGIGRI
jgi:hypothetical protein